MDGTVVIKFIDGFAPLEGQQFPLIDVGGAFDQSGVDYVIENLAPDSNLRCRSHSAP